MVYRAAMDRLTIIDDAGDADIAAWIGGRLRDALAAGGTSVAICVPGGSTPFPVLAQLAKAELDWGRIAIWPGDDRMVAEDHPASNVGRIRPLFEPLGARTVSLAADARPPRFVLTWLGMGADGHIASLFSNTDPVADDPLPVRRVTPDPLPPAAPFDRITLTIPALLASEALLFVIRGADKRAIFEAAARGENDLPVARLLAAAHQPVICFT